MTDEISRLYEELNASIINDMARRISKMKYVSTTTEWQLQRTIESGALYDEVIEKISRKTGKSKKEVGKLFKEAGAKNWLDNLKRAELEINKNSLRLSQSALGTLNAQLKKTNGILKNITMTTAKDVQNQFIHAIDLAYQQITSGAFDYNTAIRNAVKSIAREGINTIDYESGKKDRIDVAVRGAVLTGVNQTMGKMTEIQADEVGADGYETTAHSGARPNHAVWQGKQFYINIPIKRI
jgi:ribosomal protein L9